jgi:two-component sensor histidine kinase
MSLLGMSRRRVTDELAKAELENSISRLGVLARVYDRLQVKGDEGQAVVDARVYLGGLCEEIGASVIGLRPIALRTQIEAVDLDAGRAVSLGLVVNELVQNSLKYAFSDDRLGALTVRFAREGDSDFMLEVTDDGVGLDGASARPGTGTRLVRALAQQLAGTVEWSGPPGTKATLRLPQRQSV